MSRERPCFDDKYPKPISWDIRSSLNLGKTYALDEAYMQVIIEGCKSSNGQLILDRKGDIPFEVFFCPFCGFKLEKED